MLFQKFSPQRSIALFALVGNMGCAGPLSSRHPVDAATSDSNRSAGNQIPASGSSDGSALANSLADPAGSHPLIDARKSDLMHALPELKFQHLGMHIGGESNSPESKMPFLSAIALQEEAFLFCYKFVNNPGKGGSFGLDLYVRATGGQAEVRAVRQKLGGDDLVECMRTAFSKVNFDAPARPTMLSYSLLYVVTDSATKG